MLSIPGYQISDQIYESANSLVYRGIRLEDNQAVIIKFLKQDYPTPAEITRYQQEYRLTHQLNIPGVIKALSWEKYHHTPAIVFEDFGGESLKIQAASSPENPAAFSLAEFLEIGIKIATSLAAIHSANIIHKDINPANIVYNRETKDLKIIDFGISTVLSRENPAIQNPRLLEGTLPYISPEQTGRMNRFLDYRSDFYSLGVTYYEMLAGQLPFTANDALELVHCHIAKQPVPLHQINLQIPKSISNIVMKLMAKTAEERYQSAWGLKADLETCLHQWQTQGIISEFILGSQDISEKFHLTQKLYGRAQEIETLMAAFARVAGFTYGESGGEIGENLETCTLEPVIILVSGYSGVGKSALVREIAKPITAAKGYFISGKFDQYQRNIPYAAVIKALGELVKQLLSEPDKELEVWRQKILKALGANGQVITEVIPELELIIGPQPPLPNLPPTEAENRFNLCFQNFLKLFISPQHPLVIFLDDLQWADSASLKLMQLLMDSGAAGLLIIGAYRDNEVTATHPLMLTVNEMEKTPALVSRISLKPLKLDDVNQLIADTLRQPPQVTYPLAELVMAKTAGNPFFMNEFLKSLYAEGWLDFDREQQAWVWDLEQIQGQNITDNVVELMTQKIQKLPAATQEVLQLAACMGNQFDLETLAVVGENSVAETAHHLGEAMAAGLVAPLGDAYKSLVLAGEVDGDKSGKSVMVKFIHDRIQQAAYSLIPPSRQQAIHRQIGEMLLQNTTPSQREEKIFDIVNQLNQALSLITEPSSRQELAQLNLIAGQKAKTSAAYESALDYLNLAIQLLDNDSWQNQYKLTLDIYVAATQAACLCRKFPQLENTAVVVMQKASSVLDKIEVYEVNIQASMAQNKPIDAIKTARSALRLLGVTFPDAPGEADIAQALAETRAQLAEKSLEDLLQLPEMTNVHMKAAMRLLSSIFAGAYAAAPELMPLAVCKQISISLRYGNTESSAFAYSSYAIIASGIAGDIDDSYKLGQLSLKLIEQLQAYAIKAKVLLCVYLNWHWKGHIRETLTPFVDAYQNGCETGDFEFASYGAQMYCFHAYCSGSQLASLEQEMANFSLAIHELQQERSQRANGLYHQVVLNLMGKSPNPCSLRGTAYDEETSLPLHIEAQDHNSISIFHIQKMILCYWFENYSDALNNCYIAEQHLHGVVGLIHVTLLNFYDSLCHLAVLDNQAEENYKKINKKLTSNQKKLHLWAQHAPMNYQHKFDLVAAEICRVKGQNIKAIANYDRAIAGAQKNGYIQEEALANELAAKFYLTQGKITIAAAYMREARYCYLTWGANAKVKHLDTTYPQLLFRKSDASITQTRQENIPTSSTSGGQTLDLNSVMKAAQAISGEILLDNLLEKLMQILLENTGAETGYLLRESQGKFLIVARSGGENQRGSVWESIPRDNTTTLALTVVNYVVRMKESVVLTDARNEGKFQLDPYIQQQQTKSLLCVPLINQGKLVSIVYLENNLTPGAFTRERVEIVQLLSAQAAISLENAQLYRTLETKVEERTAQLAAANGEITKLNQQLTAENLRLSAELDVARRLQQMVLPKPGEIAAIHHLEIAGFMEPADEVGGDYYDVLQQDNRLKIGIGDVTGHGLESGVLMIMVQTAVRALMEAKETDPVKFLEILNRTIYGNIERMNSEKNLTMSLVDYSDGIVVLSGQHEEAILVRDALPPVVERIDTIDLGFPIGLMAEIGEFVGHQSLQLHPGDGLVLYTDGITEAENLAGEQYGIERLCAVISNFWHLSATDIRQVVIDDLRRHIGAQKVYDDITLVVVKQK
ncbi:MAG TPA: AAA family ATPase [Oscillatoriaceae cyanobacterium M33_DOE_052]|uniref:GAF domain-containing protein n=1 Tax=Planktothricoides sp. SpSt-374 TaxID=2282167 RepID=A0A7C3VKD2_9CYAN|nr:AAA family ATPase [Oscillatoriaceae cyanobacterium M33_DOE_052]